MFTPLHLHIIVHAIPAVAQLQRRDEQAIFAAHVHLIYFNTEGGAASALFGIPHGFSDDVSVSFAHLYKQGSTLGGLCDIDDSHIITCKCALFTFS